MRIAVKDIVANPYRQINKYPIDRVKVEALKTSIREKTFWDNILVRKVGEKYQLAYGHHRWIAIKELGIKEIDIPVREIDNATMLQIMAEENLNWSTSPAITTQTVSTVKEFLDAELAKCDYATSDKSIRCLFENKTGYTETKTKGVGRPTILKFLGGNWKAWMVQEALAIIEDEEIDQTAVETIPTMEQAKHFRKAVKDYEIPKPTQRKIATKIVKEGVGRRDIPALVAKHSTKPIVPEPDKPVLEIKRLLENIDSQACTLHNNIMSLRKKMKQMGIEELKGAKVWLAGSALKRLFNEMKRLIKE